jgi:hypothetical protein
MLRMSWGNKILIVFISFAGLISYMVYRCTQVPVSLVTKEYYKDELAYQEVIDQSRNANELANKIRFNQDNQSLSVVFPAEIKNSSIQGEIIFYCPSDDKKDLKWRLELNEEGRQLFDLKKFFSGRYTAKIRWESGGVKYYQETPITIINR